ncbi:hypothetical protein ACIBEJ_34045 [Nonomuraea sp. NPDC050790]|uniref:hypothetical protein n=1 Tax=Nonomuraea sp. NPDC050790 TaxID=3364371 RepID=UPI0037BDAA8C
MAIHTPEMTATETIPADTETAAAIPATDAPVTAPDGPDAAAPATGPALDADGRVGAVWAALTAEPGASATMIGAAAGLSRVVAGKILNLLEADGHARREPGVSDGTKGRAADRWYPTTATGEADATASALELPDAAPDVATAPDTGTNIPDNDAGPAPEEDVPPSGIGPADPDPADELADAEEDVADDEAIGQGSAGIEVEIELVYRADADADEPEAEPVPDDSAWARACAELSELAALFSGVITAKDEGNDVLALGSLEMAMTKVTSAHRAARATLTGTATLARTGAGTRPGSGGGVGGSVRPGGLRDLVHKHLIEYPGKEFTPYEIGQALGGRSSGAVANALDRLVEFGEAVLTTERPRRFALAPTATPALVNPPALRLAGPADTGDSATTDTNGD